MARKSRYDTNKPTAISAPKIWNTAIYARLSIEDSGIKGGDSIETQIFLMKQYIEEHPYLKLHSIYSDNGETGTNFNRPSWNTMMEDVKSGKINCIVVKDLSRFGRNYIETGNYMEKIFPFLGVRFISINDGYDSIDPLNGPETLEIALKSLMHDIYAKEASVKITAALEAKQKKGEFLGAFAAYGYLRNPEDRSKLIIDEETAPIVRDIFKWRLDGMSFYAIMKKLNDLNFPPPKKYLYNKGVISSKRYANNNMIWAVGTIKNILQNSVYTGNMAQGKTKTSLIQGFRYKKMAPDEWIVVPRMHEPIINEETFAKVQRIIDDTKKIYDGYMAKNTQKKPHNYIFKGILKCGDCNKNLTVKKKVNKSGTERYSFCCRTYKCSGGRLCSVKNVREDDLMQIVLSQIQTQIALYCDKEKLVNRILNGCEAKKNEKAVKAQIAEFKKRINEKERRLTVLYDDYSDGILSKDEYLFMKAKYSEERRLLQEQLDDFVSQSLKQNNTFVSSSKWISAVTKFNGQTELTREMLAEIVDKIVITQYNNVEVVFKYRNEYKELESAAEEFMSSTLEADNLIAESEAV